MHALAGRVMRAAGVWMALAGRQVGLKVPGLGLEIWMAYPIQSTGKSDSEVLEQAQETE